MAADELENDPFELLGVGAESTEGEIKTAYRKLSLKVHPDRNPNNPDAAHKFHELNQAYEVLLDPLRRLALTSNLKAKQARKERFAKYDAKRKNMQDELEERERAFKKQRVDKVNEARRRDQENERIKEEGRRLREDREADLRRRVEVESEVHTDDVEEEEEVPVLGQLDTTVKIKFLVSEHPNLKTPTSIASKLSRFGSIDEASVVLSMKPPKKAPTKPAKFATALVPFKQIGDAYAAVCSSERESSGLRGITISWAEGKEPKIIAWLKAKGMLAADNDDKPATVEAKGTAKLSSLVDNLEGGTASSSGFSSFPSSFPDLSAEATSKPSITPNTAGLDFESVTLMRLRQAERARLEREIREQENEDS